MRHTGAGTETNVGDSTDTTGAEPDLSNAQLMPSAGAHAHVINGGGDSESRPQNIAVNYIIKL